MLTDNPDRRRILKFSLGAIPALMTLGHAGSAFAEAAMKATGGNTGSQQDFDFFLGTWNVRHRRLRQRLAGSNDWEEFDGTTKCQSFLGGLVNMNESVAHRPGGSSSGMGIRAFDAKTSVWADWYLSGSNPTSIEAPGIGRFANGVGTFFSDDTLQDKPIKVRGIFTSITPTLAQWEQAFSPDGGQSWETNWVMRYMRTA